MEQLKLLKQMYDEGFLSQSEYETRRIQLVDILTGTENKLHPQQEIIETNDINFFEVPDKIAPSPLIITPISTTDDEKMTSPVVFSPNVVLPLQESQIIEITLEHKLFIVKHLSTLPREAQMKVLAILQNQSPSDLIEGKQIFIAC
jgi:hypothetical protein